MATSDFEEFDFLAESVLKRKQIYLPKDEYAHVISELNTHLSEEERSQKLVMKPIGEYIYTAINRGFNDYIIIAKRPIIPAVEDSWREDP